MRRDTECSVEKIMKDHFPGFTEVNFDVILHEGKTLRQRLMDDKRAQRLDKQLTMGKFYYKALREKYEGQSGPLAKCVAKNSSETVRPELVDAMRAWKARPIDREPMIQFMKDHDYGNNKETVGITKTILTTKASASAGQADYLLCCMDWFARNDLP